MPTRTEYDPLTPSPRMFWEFCAVRQEEWWNRHTKAGPPYTSDEVLRVKEIPNVFRELDGPNLFLHKHIDNQGIPYALFGAVAFRLTNVIKPHEDFGGVPRPEQAEAWLRHLEEQRSKGVAMFTRIFHTPSFFQYREALLELAEHVDLLAKNISQADGIQAAFNEVHKIPRVRNFFAWQVTADMLEAKAIEFDEDTWCYLGPGPIRALHMMYGKRMSQSEAMVYARRLLEVQDKALKNTQVPWRPPPHIPRFTLKNIEHALCEFLRWTWAHWRISR